MAYRQHHDDAAMMGHITDDDSTVMMDSPSVQALYKDDASTATGRVTQSTLQMRGSAEQKVLRGELMAQMDSGLVITVDHTPRKRSRRFRNPAASQSSCATATSY